MSDGLRVIAAAIAVGSAASVIQMEPRMFEGEEVAVLDFVRGHHRQYRELPMATTVEEETGVSLPLSPEPLAFYVDRVYERYEYNQIRERFSGLRDGLSTMDMGAVSASIADMHRVTRHRNRRGLEARNITEAVDLVAERLAATRGYGGITGIESGWPGYDEITGGYQRGDLVSVVGRPSMGKTYILLKQAQFAHEAGSSVLFVTSEMSIEQIGRRHVSIAMGINPTHLRRNTVSTHTERRIRRFYQDMIGADRFRIFSVGMNSQVSSIEAFMQEFEPDLIVVDGAYLLRPTAAPKNMNRTERITAVFDELKALTLEADRPFVVSTQFSRQAGKGGTDGSLENIGYTDAIGTHSSIVTAIRPGPTVNPKHSRWMEFLKGREGEDGKIAINFKFAPLDMDEFTPEQREQNDAGATSSTDVNWMA